MPTIIGGKVFHLSAAAEATNLHDHGTKPFGEITARAILQAAEKDMVISEENSRRKRYNNSLEVYQAKLKEAMLPYCFPARYVVYAGSAARILSNVIEAVDGEKLLARTAAEKRLYGDRKKLGEALALAHEKERAQAAE